MANKIKSLASQTAWYGISSIFARFLNYFLTPLYTSVFREVGNGEIASVYALITFCNILFTFGLETYFFKHANETNKQNIFNQSFSFLLLINIVFGGFAFCFLPEICNLISFQNQQIIICGIIIVIIDALMALPFAALRLDNKVRQYASLKIINITLNILLNLYFLVLCPYLFKANSSSILLFFYQPNLTIEYVFIANLIANFITLLLLFPIIKKWQWHLNSVALKSILIYATPLIIVGFSGMINETIDRIMLPKMLDGDRHYRFSENGIYAANYKLSIVIILFTQAFRMGAEPFFFKNAKDKNAPELYANIMKYFVIICCIGFLSVMLFLNLWQYFISAHKHKGFSEGLRVVPILLCANIFLGMYYNISIWYKIKNKTLYGACIALIGALITIVGNYFFIHDYSYLACAWTTCVCYFMMMLMAYFWGQYHFPIPYAIFKILFYIALAIVFGLLHYAFFFPASFLYATIMALVFLFIFMIIVLKMEYGNLKQLLNG